MTGRVALGDSVLGLCRRASAALTPTVRRDRRLRSVAVIEPRVRAARVYDPPAPAGGRRVLVDRLWPRGIRKGDPRIDQWLRDIAPSADLRIWYGHQPERAEEFAGRYRRELLDAGHGAAVAELRALVAAGPVVLLTASKALDISQAAVLAAWLSEN
jgi:uncharacterized protein YeaO (DUF488 family)